MTSAANCPEPSALSRLLDGSLPEGEQSGMAAHIESCSRCQAQIEQLAAGDATWDAVARQLKSGQHLAAAKPAVLKEAIASLKADALKSDEPMLAGPSPDLPPGFLSPPSEPGHLGRLGDYEVIEEIGRGAMGIVLRAFDDKLHRVVALKVMSPQLASFPLSRERFKREGQAAAAVCHEHVVTIYAVSEAAGLPYLVMQYVAGKTLQERLDESGPLKIAEILRIGMQATAGLAAAHAQGLVHRDIKPANLLLENGVERVKLTDFGLARTVDDASLTQTGVISGTPQFMAPEQARGESIDARADLFSLGCVLYTLAAGRPPFRAPTTLAVLKRICEDDPRPIRELNPEIPDWLAAIVMKLLAKQPGDRFQSARELSELLGQCLAHVQQPERADLPVGAALLGGAPGLVARPPVNSQLAANSHPQSNAPRPSPAWPAALAIVLVLLMLGCMLPVVAVVGWVLYASKGVPSSQGIIDESIGKVTDSARVTAPAAELDELDRMVGIAQKQWLVVKTQHDQGVVPLGEVIAAEAAFVQAKVRYAQAADNREDAVAGLKELIALRQKLLEIAKQHAEMGLANMSAVLDAERELSEARLALKRAEEKLAASQP